MGEESDNAEPKKGLSAHQAGLPAKHGKAQYDPDAQGGSTDALTVREQEVLLLVAADYSDAAISEKTGMKVSTVGKHLERIYPKIKVRNRASAAIWVLRRQLEAVQAENVTLKQILAETGGSSAAAKKP